MFSKLLNAPEEHVKISSRKELVDRIKLINTYTQEFQLQSPVKFGCEVQFKQHAVSYLSLTYFDIIYAYFKEFVTNKIETAKVASAIELAVCQQKPIIEANGNLSVAEMNTLFAHGLAQRFSNEIKSWVTMPGYCINGEVTEGFNYILGSHDYMLHQYASKENHSSLPILSNAGYWKLVELVYLFRRNFSKSPNPMVPPTFIHYTHPVELVLMEDKLARLRQDFHAFTEGFVANARSSFQDNLVVEPERIDMVVEEVARILVAYKADEAEPVIMSYEMAAAFEQAIMRYLPFTHSDKCRHKQINAIFACCAGCHFSSVSDAEDLKRTDFNNNGFVEKFVKIIRDHRIFLESSDPYHADFPLYCNIQYWRLLEHTIAIKHNLSSPF